MKVDLHLHTWTSDGEVSPNELVRLAARSGLEVIAVTDHDTALGVPEALVAAQTLPVSVIPGIEISSRWGERELHILGYWIDPLAPAIRRHQEHAGQRRSDRMRAMVERLQGLGVAITFAAVEQAAGPEVRTLGRPHLARALHQGGHIRTYGEAFVRFIGDGGPAFVAEGFPLPSAAIETIHAAGGLAVWAHPPLDWVEEGLPLLVEWGLDGIECYRPGMDPDQVALLERLCGEHRLAPTGGSDWHGPQRARLGDFFVPAERLHRVLDFGADLSASGSGEAG